MPGTMSQADLVTDLKGILMDAQQKFVTPNDDDFKRHLDIAALALGQRRPRTLVDTVTLVAAQRAYPAPADLLRPKFALWGTNERRSRKPWDINYPGRLPTLSVAETDGTREIHLDPAPTAAQITDFGATYTYYYSAGHVIDANADATTVQPGDRHLLLIRATAHALQELANNGITKPVQLGTAGVGSMPKNGTPGALAEQLMKLYDGMAA